MSCVVFPSHFTISFPETFLESADSTKPERESEKKEGKIGREREKEGERWRGGEGERERKREREREREKEGERGRGRKREKMTDYLIHVHYYTDRICFSEEPDGLCFSGIKSDCFFLLPPPLLWYIHILPTIT